MGLDLSGNGSSETTYDEGDGNLAVRYYGHKSHRQYYYYYIRLTALCTGLPG